MSTIPSNPHASQAEQLAVAPANGPEEEAALDNQAQLQATLALAYEQRTANLIAYIEVIDDTDRETMTEIKARLGLEGTK